MLGYGAGACVKRWSRTLNDKNRSAGGKSGDGVRRRRGPKRKQRRAREQRPQQANQTARVTRWLARLASRDEAEEAGQRIPT